jgi:tight adherence protein B
LTSAALAAASAAGGLVFSLALVRAATGSTWIRVGATTAPQPGPRVDAAPSIDRVRMSRIAWMLTGAAGGWLVANLTGAVVLGAAASFGPGFLRRRAAAARAAALDERLADAIRAVAAGLRAGLSVQQALRIATTEAEAPLSGSLERLVSDVELGEPLEAALARWAQDVGTPNARLVVGVLGLHRRSGGDLPRVLDQVATTLRERHEALREVRALTAQARLSGAILGLLPIAFFGFLWLTSRDDIEGAFRTPAGLVALTLGGLLELVAFLWIRRLLEVR